MKRIAFLLLSAIAATALGADTLEPQFQSFITTFNKKYTPEEREVRFSNFKESLRAIDELNANSLGGANFAVGKFADMSADEFKNTILMKEIIRTVDTSNDRDAVNKELDTAFDWREKGAVSAVKDQGQCGSCWAFSATQAIESTNILAGKVDNTINLSPQQIVDCAHDLVFGCNGGRPTGAYSYIIKAGGQEGMSDYPYTAKDGTCAFNSTKIEASISKDVSSGLGKPESNMQENLVSLGPLSICLDAAHWQHYTSGTLTHSQCCPTFGICQLDHCVQLVGYDASNSSDSYWIVRNSWGTDWGLDGYIHIEMGKNSCGITNEVSWPTI